MWHSREPMNSSCRLAKFVEVSTTRFFPQFFGAPNWRPLRKEAATSIERISTTAGTLDIHFFENQVTQFFPRTWGSKTIPRRSLAASSRGKIRREWQSCLEMSRSRFFGWTRDITMVPHKHHTFSHAMNLCRSNSINSNIYITHTSPTSPGNISRFYVDCFSLRLSWIHLELMVAGWLIVWFRGHVWHRLTCRALSRRRPSHGHRAKWRKWPKSWNSKDRSLSFCHWISLDPLLSLLMFLLITFNLFGSLEFQKQKKTACSCIAPANLWLVFCSARIH